MEAAIQDIGNRATEFGARDPLSRDQLRAAIRAAVKAATASDEEIFRQMGLDIIWIDNHRQIASDLRKLLIARESRKGDRTLAR